ncbi:glycosyltransferase family 4 protein [bacterium]|nr:glycosyltransferase family 4 protein [bacterium]
MSAFYHGGAEVQFKRLAFALAENDYKVELWSLERPTPNDLSELQRRSIGFKLFAFDFLKYQNGRWKYLIYLANYLKLACLFLIELQKSKSQVLISYGMILAPFIPLFKILKRRVFFSCRTATSILERRRYLASFYNMADVVITNSLATNNYLDQIGVLKSKISLINNGVHVNGAPSFNIRQPIKVVSLIGRIHPIKNHLFLLDSLRNHSEYEIIFAGPISNHEYYQLLQQTIDRYHMSSRVQFSGFVEKVEVIYQRADVVVLPSFEEGCSNVILECFKYGKLCIASNIKTNKELLQGRGYLIDTGDRQSLISVIKRIDNTDPHNLHAMVERNFGFLAKNFSIGAQVSRYKELILEKS